MAKVKLSMNRAWFHCPGCKHAHCFRLKAPPNDPNQDAWGFNGDVDSPTFTPSLLNTTPKARCHLFVTDGKIRFLGDCHHWLAGQTVEMEEVR